MKRFPLHACEVAEREFVAIQGRPASVPDWLLRPVDVDLDKLVARLRLADPAAAGPVAVIRQELAAQLKVPDTALGDDGNRSKLVDTLNKLLGLKDDLFDPDLLNRSAPARELAELAKGEELEADDRQQLNRMLLEAAFPADVIARADTVRLGRVYEEVHGLRGPSGIHSALCLSGGGIRSASFALGVIQGLARCRLLERFDYLSTVSGGGYVGSWLSTWIHRHPRGLTGVVEELKQDAAKQAGGITRKLEPEPAPIRFLRSYSHFLNPKAGLFSADTWTWVGIYLRNLFLNWLALIPLLLLCLAAPRLYAALMFDGDVTGALFPLLFWLATAFAIIALVCATANRPSLTDPTDAAGPAQRRVALFKTQAGILNFGAIPLFLFGMLVTLMAWDVPPSVQPLSWEQIRALVSASRLADWPYLFVLVLPFIAFQHIVLWGEALVVFAWLVSLTLIPRRGKLLYEFFAILFAGLITWSLVALLVDFIERMPPSPTGVLEVLDVVVAADHLYAVFAVPVAVLVFLAGMALFIGLVSKHPMIDDEDREWWARFGAWVLVLSAGWMAASFVTVFGPPLLLKSPTIMSAVGGLSGLLAVLLGKSSHSPATNEQSSKPATQQDGKGKGLAALVSDNVLAIASFVFLAVFLAVLSLLTSAALAPVLDRYRPQGYSMPFTHACGDGTAWPSALRQNVFESAQLHLEIVCQTPVVPLLAAMLALGLLLLLASTFINLNKFSLHAAYRIRIVRTFLGASRNDRRPNPFTGFDPLDNVQMHELQPGLLREGDVVDLPGFVTALRTALLDEKRTSPQRRLAELVTDPLYDRSEVLRTRLEAHEPGHEVLKSLQRTLLETLNRVLDSVDLDRDDAFKPLLAEPGREKERDQVDRYVKHNNRIFGNRVLLGIAFPEQFAKYDFPPPPPHKLMHVVNLTLNLVHGRRLAWQERKAAPFVVTPMHCGSYYLGYRSSRQYGGREGISIGTAVAISGAAVSPNMGYSSSPVTALLLTLFNVRLGWWLGNPGIAGADTYASGEPRNSLHAILLEALGLTDDRSPYVYLSDGGHFENMALFEMVLRRCRLVIVSDAGADPNYAFEDLGNAVRKIRIDLGIPIEFTTMPIRKAKDGNDTSGHYCAVGRIRYSCVDGADASDGLLICFKPVLCNIEPRDVINYSAQHGAFPQEPTSDQFFGESQFESYRQLGQFAVEHVLEKCAKAGDDRWPAVVVESLRFYLGNGSADWEPWLADWQKRTDLGSNKESVQP